MGHKKVNAGWVGCVGYKPVPPAEPTEFDRQVRRLRLAPADYGRSQPLRNWVYQNYQRVYVPERLLERFLIFIDV